MKNWIRELLGINELYQRNTHLSMKFDMLSAKFDNVVKVVAVRDRALGRIIAKLDPYFAVPEDNASRKAESDRISDEVIKRLYAEHEASNRFPS